MIKLPKDKISLASFGLIGASVLLLVIAAVFYTQSGVGQEVAQPASSVTKEPAEQANGLDAQLQVQPVAPITEADHYVGSLNAPVQFIVYSDFECPASLRYAEAINVVRKAYGDKIVAAFRHFPLRFHDQAMPAAMAAECAGEQGKFWEMHDKLFEDNGNNVMSMERYKQNAEALKLDQIKFLQCLETEKYKDEITQEMANGRNYGAKGTPATFINGRMIPGAYKFEDFKDSTGTDREGLKTIIDGLLR